MKIKNCTMILTVEEAKDREKWLSIRNTGIGGSDAGVIMGYNPYKSLYQLWLEKTGMAEPEDLSGNQAVYWGQRNEGNIAKWFREETGKKVERCGTLRNYVYPFMIANVDRVVVGENAGLEIKTAGASQYKNWKDDELPGAYYCQCLHYMAVTGATSWYIAVLLGGNEARWKMIRRNEADIKVLIEAEQEFWHLVETKTPPPIDGSISCAKALSTFYKGGKPPIHLSDEIDQVIQSYQEDNETLKKLTEAMQYKKNLIMQALGDAEEGTSANHKVTWKTSKGRESISLTKIKKEDAELYENLKIRGLVSIGEPSRVLRIK